MEEKGEHGVERDHEVGCDKKRDRKGERKRVGHSQERQSSKKIIVINK